MQRFGRQGVGQKSDDGVRWYLLPRHLVCAHAQDDPGRRVRQAGMSLLVLVLATLFRGSNQRSEGWDRAAGDKAKT